MQTASATRLPAETGQNPSASHNASTAASMVRSALLSSRIRHPCPVTCAT
ncbi:hypothetical protein BN134_757 [Cronobacter dublinensis 1210]|uniref:Uncharacterized protein n=1 Tax=Cronobacter dublinensis 1210 TaxID=1208656 RepID=A0ABP1W4P9_9ENTR|nr:hypothetical protein BN134_757 [Cronobacter dublinensis 1210]